MQFLANKQFQSILFISSLTLFSVTGCGGSSNKNAPALDSRLHGIWENTGYGNVIKIDGKGGNLYQFTRATCLKTETLDNTEIGAYFSLAEFSEDESSLAVREENGPAFPKHYQRLGELPETCTGNELITSPTPDNIFQHLWHTFNDYYAFFNERNVDWAARYANLQPLVSDDMDDEALFELLADLLSPIDDGHIELDTGDVSYNPARPDGADRIIEEAFPNQDDYDDIQQFANALSQQYSENLNHYLDPQSIKSIDGVYPDRAIWGTINQSVGFLLINSMQDFSVDDGENTPANLEVVHRFMPQVINDLQATQALIVDVRFNSGGEDAISLAIASYFTDQRRMVTSKNARYWADETTPVEAYITPANESTYLKPVIVISGENSASAAEVFLMAMGVLPHVTLLGENSSGALSDSLDKQLPNGWSFSLSNEVYSDANGNSPEVSGVTPHIQSPAFSIEAIKSGRNAAIDKALEILGL